MKLFESGRVTSTFLVGALRTAAISPKRQNLLRTTVQHTFIPCSCNKSTNAAFKERCHLTPRHCRVAVAAKRSQETRSCCVRSATDPRYAAMQLKLALLCLATGADAFAARSTVRRTTRLAAAADDFPRETARAAYSRFDDVCADEECDARELADDNGWDELRRLARREEAQDRAAAEKAAIAAFRARLEERWRE